MKSRWYKDAVIYQIYPRSFCDSNGDGIGDLQGIISKIEYIKQLGVTAVWLSPCYKSPNEDNGYDISDYYNIMPEFGTMSDFDEMLNKFHQNGIKVLMDLVVNHTASEHKWFIESKKSLDNPYRDYYIWKKGKGKDGKKPPNNWTSRFTGTAWQYDELTKEFYLHLFSKNQPDLNWENPKVRQEIADICNFWLKKGVDGFRCDVITYISKNLAFENGKPAIALIGDEQFTLGPNYHKYMKELASKSYNNFDSFVVGEAIGTTVSDAVGLCDEKNAELDSVIAFDIVNSQLMLSFIPKRFNLPNLKKIINKWQTLPDTTWNTNYFENHDQPRSIPTLTNGGDLMLAGKTLATVLLLLKGTPIVYQGEELGMTNCEFERSEYVDVMAKSILSITGKYVPFLNGYFNKIVQMRARENPRTPVQWSDGENAGFTTGKPWLKINPNYKTINAKLQINDENSLLSFYKKIIKFKLNNKALINGSFNLIYPENKSLFVFERKHLNNSVLVIANFKNKNVNFHLPSFLKDVICTNLFLSNYPVNEALQSTTLRPYESRIYNITYK